MSCSSRSSLLESASATRAAGNCKRRSSQCARPQATSNAQARAFPQGCVLPPTTYCAFRPSPPAAE
eukprot:11180129-Alexandrium_andersonii.AAC.1